MFANNSILVGQAAGVANSLGDLFFPTTGATGAVPKALNELWDIAMNGVMYKLVCNIGVFVAVLAIGFWCVKFYKVLNEGSLQPALNEMILPILLVILLSNSGANMRELTLTTRNIMNGVNKSVNVVVNADVSFQTALRILGGQDQLIGAIGRRLDLCKDNTDLQEYELCVRVQGQASLALAQQITGNWQTGSNATNGTKWQKQVQDWQTYATKLSKNPFAYKTPEEFKTALANGTGNKSDDKTIQNVVKYEDTEGLRETILSCRTAFLYIVEIMMVVTGLVGPIFLALALFPFGNKPFLSWAISFLSLGFCKICFSLVSGLSAIAMVYTGPDDTDMLVVAIVLGLLAPAISFSIASGAGIGALNTLSYAGQNFGLNTGISYAPSPGGGGATVPPTAFNNSQQQSGGRNNDSTSGG